MCGFTSRKCDCGHNISWFCAEAGVVGLVMCVECGKEYDNERIALENAVEGLEKERESVIN